VIPVKTGIQFPHCPRFSFIRTPKSRLAFRGTHCEAQPILVIASGAGQSHDQYSVRREEIVNLKYFLQIFPSVRGAVPFCHCEGRIPKQSHPLRYRGTSAPDEPVQGDEFGLSVARQRNGLYKDSDDVEDYTYEVAYLA
jgi:hypothetical protein